MITNSNLKEKHFLELQKIFDDVSSVTDTDMDKIFKQIHKAATIKVSVNVYWDPNSKTKLNVTPKQNSTYLLFNFLMRIEKESVLKKTFRKRINLFLESLKDTIASGEISLTKLPGQIQMEKSNEVNLWNYCLGKFPLSIVPENLMKDFLFGFLYESDSPSEPVLEKLITKNGILLNEFSNYQEIFDTQVIPEFIQNAKSYVFEGSDPANVVFYINSFSKYFSEDFRNNIFEKILLEVQKEIQIYEENDCAFFVSGILRMVEKFNVLVESNFKPFFTSDKFKEILINVLTKMNFKGMNTIYFYLRLFNVTDKIGLPLSEIIVDEEYNIKVPLNHTSTNYWLSNRDDEINCLKQFIDIVKTNNIKTTLHFNQDKEISIFRSIDLLLETFFCLLDYHQVDLSGINIEVEKSLSDFVTEMKDRPELFTGKVECSTPIKIELDIVKQTFAILAKSKEV